MFGKNKEKKWYQTEGNKSDVVISSRIRLARNLNGYPFPHIMDNDQKKTVNEKVRDALFNGNAGMKDSFRYIQAEDLSAVELAGLVERHLVSNEFAGDPKGKALLLMNDESVSIMLNEEDHLRIQVLDSGLALEELYDTADKIDTLLDETLHFAFDEELGYLTACPTNLGTGMRASVMLHLPAIESNGTLRRLSAQLNKIDMTIRGSYGEGSDSISSMYQISNQSTLGISEKDTISNLIDVTNQLITLEKKAREQLLQNAQYQDSMWRSLGILKSARVMSSKEFDSLYSIVRMGVAEGAISGITLEELQGIFEAVQPAGLMEQNGGKLSPEERDKKRAEILREKLKNTEIE